MDGCVFCKIVSGEIPSVKVYEDDWVVGVMDLFPNTKGQCLIISKSHEDPDFTKTNPDVLENALKASRKVAEKLKKALGVKRVGIIMEGMAVNHFHIKVYPFHGDLKADHSKLPKVWFETYPGYMTSLTGKMANSAELEEIGKRVREA